MARSESATAPGYRWSSGMVDPSKDKALAEENKQPGNWCEPTEGRELQVRPLAAQSAQARVAAFAGQEAVA